MTNKIKLADEIQTLTMEYFKSALEKAKEQGEELPASFLKEIREFLKDNEVFLNTSAPTDPEEFLGDIPTFPQAVSG